ncbi:MAG: DNA primase [bacterium]|nr:DNA primase [bacterium]
MSNEIEEIKDKLDIVDYVGKVVQLKKTGQNYKGLCPFHSEKTPSFIVSQDKQIFHCFGCNEGGDIFAWVMKTDGMEFSEALKKLAADAGVTLTREHNPERSDAREKLFDINEEACAFFEGNLKSDTGKTAADYFKKRKLTDKTIKEFRLGYAPGMNALIKKMTAEGYDKKDMVSAGVAKEKEGKLVDQFRARVTFPIINTGGRPVGFSARVLGDGIPKYLNTPSTDIYDKSGILYGIYQAKEAMRKQNHTIVVEGNMDVIASHQAGVKNVVASSGTALTERQLDILKKFSPNIKLAFDIDPAGDMATRRAIEMAFAKGINLKIIEIPEGKDAADVVAKDPKIWIDAVKEATYVMDYLFEKLFTGDIEKDILKKKKVTREFISFIAKLEDMIERDHYIKKLAEKINVGEDAIRKTLDRTSPKASLDKSKEAKSDIQNEPIKVVVGMRGQIEERVLGIGLGVEKCHGFLFESLEPEDFNTDTMNMLYKKAKNHYNANKVFDLKEFNKLLKQEEAKSFNVLLVKNELETENLNEEEVQEEIFYLAKKIKQLNVADEKAALSREIKEAEKRKDDKCAKDLIKKMQELLKKEQSL